MPAKLVRRSAMNASESAVGGGRRRYVTVLPPPTAPFRQHLVYALRRRHALRCRIHNLRAAIRTVPPDKDSGMVLGPHERRRALADRHDHHVAGNRLAAIGGPHLDSRHRTGSVRDDAL